MRKQTSAFLIEYYDELSHRVGMYECKNFLHAKKIATFWESKKSGYNAVISRVLYNTNYKNDKWGSDEN